MIDAACEAKTVLPVNGRAVEVIATDNVINAFSVVDAASRLAGDDNGMDSRFSVSLLFASITLSYPLPTSLFSYPLFYIVLL